MKTTNDQKRKVIRSTDDLNRLFRVIVGAYMKSLYYDSQIEEQDDRLGVKRFASIISPIEDIEQGQLIASNTVYKQLAKDYIIRDLFLWSIVMNYMELAKVFLAHMKDRTCAALIATEILLIFVITLLKLFMEIKKQILLIGLIILNSMLSIV